MRYEYNMRDLENYTYCGGPKEYDYPTYQEFTSTTYQTDIMAWSKATSKEMFEHRDCWVVITNLNLFDLIIHR